MKLTEDKIEKLLNSPEVKKRLKDSRFKSTNIAAQKAMKNIPNVKTDGILELLDWMENYLLALKGK